MTQAERRKHERVKRKFVVSYRAVNEPPGAPDISQIKDISLGGMRFIASRNYAPDTILLVELQTPFIREKLSLKAKVLESKEVMADLIYDTRLMFLDLDEDARHYLARTIEIFLKQDKEKEEA